MIAKQEMPPPLSEAEFRTVIRTVLVGAVQYGYVKIRYEAGQPTIVERCEQVRLTGTRPEP